MKPTRKKVPVRHEVERDQGYGPSHGYGPGHGGPTGPGDVPGDELPHPRPRRLPKEQLEEEEIRPSEESPAPREHPVAFETSCHP